MKCESKYCENELIDPEHKFGDDWINAQERSDKYYSRDFMGKKLCTDCYSLEYF